MARKGSAEKPSGRRGQAAAKDTWRGWAFIVLLAVAIVAFVALGAMDADTRYDLIGL